MGELRPPILFGRYDMTLKYYSDIVKPVFCKSDLDLLGPGKSFYIIISGGLESMYCVQQQRQLMSRVPSARVRFVLHTRFKSGVCVCVLCIVNWVID